MLFSFSMKHLGGYDNIFETEALYFWGNMKVLLGHLDWGVSSKDLQNDFADIFSGNLYTLYYEQNVGINWCSLNSTAKKTHVSSHQ